MSSEGLRLATITSVSPSGCLLRFDGEDAARTKPYKYLSLPAVGQRVVVSMIGGSGVVIGGMGLGSDWAPVPEVWTYASATTITVPAGAASQFQRGDKLKLTQGGNVKYFYIVNVASTLLTVTGGTDYTVENAAISDIYVSRAASPFGFPAYFNWLPTIYGSTTAGSPTYGTTRRGEFSMHGGLIYVAFHLEITNKGGMAGDVRVGGLPIAPTIGGAAYLGYVAGFSVGGSKSLAGQIYVATPAYIRFIYNQSTWLADTDINNAFSFYNGGAFYY